MSEEEQNAQNVENGEEQGEEAEEQQAEEQQAEEQQAEEQQAEELEQKNEEELKPMEEHESGTLSKDHLRPLSREDFNMEIIKNWSKIICKRPPKRRTWHSSFLYEDTYLYIIGGIDITEKKQNDIYKIDLSSSKPEWEKVELTEGELEPIAYHGGAVFEDIYYIVGGQNRELKPLNLIQKFDIKNNKILPPTQPKEEEFPALDGHTVNLLENKLFVYGGIGNEGLNKDVYLITIQKPEEEQKNENKEGEEKGNEEKEDDELEPKKKEEKKDEERKKEITFEFTNLTSNLDGENIPKPRKFHSSLIKGDSLFIYGGLGVENEIYGDMWEYSLGGNTFTKIEMDSEDEKAFPKPRSGARMFLNNDQIFLFGGKLDLIKESNELWKFEPGAKKFTLIHDTLIEKFTDEELARNKRSSNDDNKGKKKFRLLSRHEVEQRTNPLPYNMKNDKKTKDKKGASKAGKQKKKVDEESSSTSEQKSQTSAEVLSRPNVSKMKKSLIYTSQQEELEHALKELKEDEKAILKKEVIQVIAEVPEPRDGMTMDVLRGTKVVLFGGDRNKFPFNDIFLFDMNINCSYYSPEQENQNQAEGEEAEEGQETEEGQEVENGEDPNAEL